MRTLKHRLGQFIFVVSLIVFAMFFAGWQNPIKILFFIGLAGMVLGFWMMRQSSAPSEPSNRFRTLRKYMDKSKKK